ncbi:hypothetical protein ACKKBG_A21320 [Auxenochlorella protothecoides x Auxenochlorella symbiontica]
MFTSMTSWRPPPGPKEVECASLGGSSCTSQPCTPPSSSECSEGEPSLQGPRPRESPGVRAKAAFFEALIKSNTTALVRCSAPDSPLPDHDACPDFPEDDGDPSDRCPSSPGYSEVTMTLRLPRRARSPAPRPLPDADREALAVRLAALEAALARRSAECDNLTRVVRELSEGRVKTVCARAVLAEKHAELAAEYHRMQRIADLSRTVSKENLAKTSKTLKALRQVQQELYATKKRAQALEERNRKIKDENLALREKVGLLERYDFEHVQQSVCMRHYTRCRVAETY